MAASNQPFIPLNLNFSEAIIFYLPSAAAAMKILQSKGIVHRDLKPQNILLSHSGISHPRPADIKIKIGECDGAFCHNWNKEHLYLTLLLRIMTVLRPI